VNKKPTNALIIHSVGTQYSPTCFSTSKCHHQEVKYDPAEIGSRELGSRKGWQLYILTQLPSFSASQDMGTYLSRIIFDFLMMAF
jgi:hypothetical protein